MSEPAITYDGPENPAVVDRATISTALLTSFPNGDPRMIEDYATSLCAVAEHFDIPFELLRRWIYDRPTGKDFSLASWRAWCTKYSEVRAKLPAGVDG